MEKTIFHDAICRMFFGLSKMLIVVFGNSFSPHDNGNKIDSDINVQKHYLGTIYKGTIFEEDFDFENQFRIRNLLDPISIREPT